MLLSVAGLWIVALLAFCFLLPLVGGAWAYLMIRSVRRKNYTLAVVAYLTTFSLWALPLLYVASMDAVVVVTTFVGQVHGSIVAGFVPLILIFLVLALPAAGIWLSNSKLENIPGLNFWSNNLDLWKTKAA